MKRAVKTLILLIFCFFLIPKPTLAKKGTTIWGYAFYDFNRNGKYDPGEKNLPKYSVIQLWVKRGGRSTLLGNYYPTKPTGRFYIPNIDTVGWHVLRITKLPPGHQPTTSTSYIFYLDGKYKKLGPYYFGAAPISISTPTPIPTPTPTQTPQTPKIALKIPKKGKFPIKKVSTSPLTSSFTLSPFKIFAYSPKPQNFNLTLSSSHLFLKSDKKFFIDVKNLTVKPKRLKIKGNKPKKAKLGRKHRFSSPSDQALILEVKGQQGYTEFRGDLRLSLNIPPNQIAGEYEGILIFTLQ